MSLTGYHKQMKDLTDDLILHGYGEMTVKVVSFKDKRVRIQINCGKMFVYIIEKDYDLKNNII